jgi:hypothetical protein
MVHFLSFIHGCRDQWGRGTKCMVITFYNLHDAAVVSVVRLVSF